MSVTKKKGSKKAKPTIVAAAANWAPSNKRQSRYAKRPRRHRVNGTLEISLREQMRQSIRHGIKSWSELKKKETEKARALLENHEEQKLRQAFSKAKRNMLP